MSEQLENKFDKKQDKEQVKKYKDRNKNDRKACIVANRFDKKAPSRNQKNRGYCALIGIF